MAACGVRDLAGIDVGGVWIICVHVQVFIPFMAFGCLAMMSGLLIMTMPETLGAAMPETVAVSCGCQASLTFSPPPSVAVTKGFSE